MGAAEAPRAGTSCAGPTIEHVGRTLCYSHVPPPALGRPSPSLAKPLLQPTPGHRASVPRASGWHHWHRGGEGRTPRILLTASLSRSCLWLLFPLQSQEHPPANIHAWLGAVGGLDCSHYGFWWKGEQKAERGSHPSFAAAMFSPAQDQPRMGWVGSYSPWCSPRTRDHGDHTPLIESPWGPHTWCCPKTPRLVL